MLRTAQARADAAGDIDWLVSVETSRRRTSAIGVEDLSVWPGSPHQLWTATEHPGMRMLFSVTP
ncbi:MULTISPECIES: hypothetical protein [Streptomyces]|uniref:hypothetical protein n=1 Tax=Streptomyces TaxID=1883 RepID=UPI001319A0E1|nr:MULTISPECIES: hypothetical protein [Streptomyces]QGZ47256.1 hypothetical protein GPZ77_01470 [Streptomyces sp. QHH-9511]GGT80639.1 hypothetical protein GCM10010272_26430 [Streptomyces lateritius]